MLQELQTGLINRYNNISHRVVCARRQKTDWTFLAQKQRLPRAVFPWQHHAYGTVCPPGRHRPSCSQCWFIPNSAKDPSLPPQSRVTRYISALLLLSESKRVINININIINININISTIVFIEYKGRDRVKSC